MNNFFQRINYTGKLEDISLALCNDFDIGEFVSSRLVTSGYEDFNFILETTKGKYFIKVFANFRSDEDCIRYIEILLKVIQEGVSFPRLLKLKERYLHIKSVSNAKLRLCVMEYIDGESYYFLGQKPSIDEIKFLAYQSALINSIDIKPKFIYDSWAITSLLNEFQRKGKYLSQQDLKIVDPLVEKFEDIDIEKIPHCFVHGDIIVTNVMKDKSGKIRIIDFAVSNYYPRIQELAVLACNILFDKDDKSKSESNLRVALDEYQKIIKLTQKELEILPTYIGFAHVMHILLPSYEKVVEKNNSEENEYWLNQGRIGLLQMLNI